MVLLLFLELKVCCRMLKKRPQGSENIRDHQLSRQSAIYILTFLVFNFYFCLLKEVTSQHV